MKRNKQLKVLELLALGYYKVLDSLVFWSNKQTKTMSGNTLQSGYVQYSLCDRKGNRIAVYKHILIYLYHYGEYPEGYVIDHIDRNVNNNHPSNLRAITHAKNKANSTKGLVLSKWLEPIRDKEIKEIRRLLNDGLSQSQIAIKVDRKRLAVRYVIKQIQAGNKLKFEK